ncbi:hypothetical protein M9434_001019 [Picochlorum sp. BPE23]|nr:hypothetical protein M9434_001019 [Picochlorum sp. BPE23]WPT12848.1 Hypoxanthine-guanine phosphoribosyltransferase [Picochlorum sp. SENEW3]
MHPDLSDILLSEEELSFRVTELGRELAKEYADKEPLVVATLKGSTIFMSDLVRCMQPVPPNMRLEFIRASSYGSGTTTSGQVSITMSTLSDDDIKGRHILLVEDIVDSGLTGQALTAYFQQHSPASVKLVSLLSKPSRREVPFEPDWLAFEIEDKFVVGYGLDYDQHYRSLPYIGVMKS